MSEIEYTIDVQKLFLEMMIHDAQSYVRVQNIYNPENFDRSLRETAKFIQDHAEKQSTMPTIEQVNAVGKSKLKPASVNCCLASSVKSSIVKGGGV